MAVPLIITSVMVASAPASRQSGKMSPSTARATVAVAAQPSACTARASTSTSSVGAKAPSSEPRRKTATPPSSRGRRP